MTPNMQLEKYIRVQEEKNPTEDGKAHAESWF